MRRKSCQLLVSSPNRRQPAAVATGQFTKYDSRVSRPRRYGGYGGAMCRRAHSAAAAALRLLYSAHRCRHLPPSLRAHHVQHMCFADRTPPTRTKTAADSGPDFRCTHHHHQFAPDLLPSPATRHSSPPVRLAFRFVCVCYKVTLHFSYLKLLLIFIFRYHAG